MRRISLVTLLLVSAVLLSGLVDWPGHIPFGQVSFMAVLTIVYTVLAGILWLARPELIRPAIVAVGAFIGFLVFGLLSFTWYTPTGTGTLLRILLASPGLQSLLVLSAFVGFIALASYESYCSYKFPWLVQRTLVRATWLAVALYGITLLVAGELVPKDPIVGPRSFALFALIGVAWYLSAWRYGSRRGFWLALAITVVIGVSLSRAGLIAALILFPLSQMSLRSTRVWVRVSLLIVLLGGSTYLAVTYIEPLNARFFEGDVELEVGGTALNVSGRALLWQALEDSYVKSPIVGHGAGSASELIRTRFSSGGVGNEHVHNEYLRILHDYGLVGGGLWLLGYVSLLWTVWRNWRRADRTGDTEAPLHLASLLSLVAIASVMITDNAAIYIFVMAPLGVLVGASLGRTRHTKSLKGVSRGNVLGRPADESLSSTRTRHQSLRTPSGR